MQLIESTSLKSTKINGSQLNGLVFSARNNFVRYSWRELQNYWAFLLSVETGHDWSVQICTLHHI